MFKTYLNCWINTFTYNYFYPLWLFINTTWQSPAGLNYANKRIIVPGGSPADIQFCIFIVCSWITWRWVLQSQYICVKLCTPNTTCLFCFQIESCHLCLLISCYSLAFWILSFDCSFCLTARYLYFLLVACINIKLFIYYIIWWTNNFSNQTMYFCLHVQTRSFVISSEDRYIVNMHPTRTKTSLCI